MNNLSSVIQILFIVVAVLGPTIGAIVRKVKAHADEKRIEAERQKRRIEAIRTGRVAELDEGGRSSAPASVKATPSRSEAAEAIRRQRQEQIAELRRRYQAQQAQQRAQRQAQQQAAQRGSPAPTQMPGRSPGRSPGQARPTPVRTQASPRPGAAQPTQAQRQAELERRREEIRRRREAMEKQKQARQAATQQRKRGAAPPVLPADPTAPIKVDGKPKIPPPGNAYTAIAPRHTRLPALQALRNRDELRRAIVLNEILSKPVSMRPPADSA